MRLSRSLFFKIPVVIGCCGIFSLGGCHSSNKRFETDQPVRVDLLKGPSSVALAALLEIGDSIDGRPVEYTLHDNPVQIQALMLQKKSDLCVLPLPAAANLYNKFPAYRMMGCPVWGSLFLICRKGEAEENNRELYLFGRGTTPDLLAKELLKETRIRYIFDSAPLLAQALLAGEVDRALLPEPFASLVLQRDSSLKIECDLAQKWHTQTGTDSTGFPQTALLIGDHYLNSDPNVAIRWDSLCRKAVGIACHDPQRISPIISRMGILPDTTLIEPVIRRSRITYRSFGDCQRSVKNALEIFLKRAPKSVGGRMPDDRFGWEKP